MQQTVTSFPVVVIKNVARIVPKRARQKETPHIWLADFMKAGYVGYGILGLPNSTNQVEYLRPATLRVAAGLMTWRGYSMK